MISIWLCLFSLRISAQFCKVRSPITLISNLESALISAKQCGKFTATLRYYTMEIWRTKIYFSMMISLFKFLIGRFLNFSSRSTQIRRSMKFSLIMDMQVPNNYVWSMTPTSTLNLIFGLWEWFSFRCFLISR